MWFTREIAFALWVAMLMGLVAAVCIGTMTNITPTASTTASATNQRLEMISHFITALSIQHMA